MESSSETQVHPAPHTPATYDAASRNSADDPPPAFAPAVVTDKSPIPAYKPAPSPSPPAPDPEYPLDNATIKQDSSLIRDGKIAEY